MFSFQMQCIYMLCKVHLSSAIFTRGNHFCHCLLPWMIKPGPEVIKLFSCSTHLNMEFFLLINVEMPTVIGILTVMSGKNSILGLSEPKNR